MTLHDKKITSYDVGEQNPFVKSGDIILLKNRQGKFKVLKADQEGIKAIPEKSKDMFTSETYSWKDFAGWRSK